MSLIQLYMYNIAREPILAICTVVPVKQVRLCTLVPAAHELHAVVLSQYLPIPHSSHTDAPSFAAYLPCSKAAQALGEVPAQRFS